MERTGSQARMERRARGVRIYLDESGTHTTTWLVIGALFVRNHGALHSSLCKVKDEIGYFNQNPKRKAKYKETHFAGTSTDRDAEINRRWIDEFLRSDSYFRSVVVDWSTWQGRYFGDPFEPEALKKRRAYKKWTEMLLSPEVHGFQGAVLYLDRLLLAYGYDVLDHLRIRFSSVEYEGEHPWIQEFQSVRSWKDAHQCLQLTDLLVGCIYQGLVPSTNEHKLATRDYLYERLEAIGVAGHGPRYWRGFSKRTLRQRFPKYSEWYWRPGE